MTTFWNMASYNKFFPQMLDDNFLAVLDGSKTFTALNVTGTSNLDGAVTINDSGIDADFRVEGLGQENALFVDGSNGKVGIGTGEITQINASANMFADAVPAMEIITGTTAGEYEDLVTIRHATQTDSSVLRKAGLVLKLSSEIDVQESRKMGSVYLYSNIGYGNSPSLGFATKNLERMTILYEGNIGIGTTTPETMLELAGAEPYITLQNTTQEDTLFGRESRLSFKGLQSGGEESTLARIQASHDGASDDEKGILTFYTNSGSDGDSPTERMRIASDGSIVINETGVDSDFRIEAVGAKDALFVQGSSGFVGLGTNNPPNILTIYRGDTLSQDNCTLRIDSNNSDTYSPTLFLRNTGTAPSRIAATSQLKILINDVEIVSIYDGTTVFNETGLDSDFRVEASGQENALFVQGSDGKVGIGTNTPSEALEVKNGEIKIDCSSITTLNNGTSVYANPAQTNTTFNYFYADQGGEVFSVRGDGKIYTAGNVGVNVSSPDYPLHVDVGAGVGAGQPGIAVTSGDTGSSEGAGIVFGCRLSGGGRRYFSKIAGISNSEGTGGAVVLATGSDDSGTLDNRLMVDRDGGIYAYSLATDSGTDLVINASDEICKKSSSSKYKENITKIEDHIDLTKFKDLNPVRYNYKESKTVDYGMIAEEVNEVFPEIINKSKSGEIDSFRMDGIVAILVKMVQNQQKEIDLLKTRIEKIERKNK